MKLVIENRILLGWWKRLEEGERFLQRLEGR